MHILGINKNNDVKKKAAFWIIGTIKYAYLQLNSWYLTWNIKVFYDKDVVDNFREILPIGGFFGKTWIKPTNNYLNISTNKAYIKDLTVFMNNSKEQE